MVILGAAVEHDVVAVDDVAGACAVKGNTRLSGVEKGGQSNPRTRLREQRSGTVVVIQWPVATVDEEIILDDFPRGGDGWFPWRAPTEGHIPARASETDEQCKAQVVASL